MTQARITAMTLATALLLAGCSATAGGYRESTTHNARHVGEKGIEACTQPGGEGQCSTIRNVRIVSLGFEERGDVSFSKAQDG